MKDLAGLELTANEFEELRALCKGDALFPSTLAEWTQLLREAADAALHSGTNLPPALPLEPWRFKRWCARVGIVPCLDALRAYAIVHRSPMATLHYGPLELDSRSGELSQGDPHC